MHSEGCIICGKELVYSIERERVTCSICNRESMSDVKCPDGHFICNDCHEASAKITIMETCMRSKIRDPIELATRIMRCPPMNMHGPEHHLLVGCVLATTYHNNGGDIDLPTTLRTICDRMSEVPGGTCGNFGCCGAAVSAGTSISVMMGATPLTERSWGLSNLMTSRCLESIGTVGGPRCCKRDTFLSLITASDLIWKELGVKIDHITPVCEFHGRNRQCIGSRCPFHPSFKV